MSTTQKDEIKTIKEREFKIKLSYADVERLYAKAGSVGMIPSELLAKFIGDLVCGTYANGSDETMYANEWFDRCGFSYANESFLSWLIDYEGVREADYIADMYNGIVSFDRENFLLEYGKQATAEAEEEIKEDMAKIIKLFGEYCKSNSDAKAFEEEMKLLLKWHEDFKKHTVF